MIRCRWRSCRRKTSTVACWPDQGGGFSHTLPPSDLKQLQLSDHCLSWVLFTPGTDTRREASRGMYIGGCNGTDATLLSLRCTLTPRHTSGPGSRLPTSISKMSGASGSQPTSMRRRACSCRLSGVSCRVFCADDQGHQPAWAATLIQHPAHIHHRKPCMARHRTISPSRLLRLLRPL